MSLVTAGAFIIFSLQMLKKKFGGVFGKFDKILNR